MADGETILQYNVHGRVKWFLADRGYGFIVRQDTGDDVYVQATGISSEKTNSWLTADEIV